MNNPKRQLGFTLVELIVTITILTVLAGIIIPSVNSYVEKSNRGKAVSDMRHMASVFTQYKVDTRLWPSKNNAKTVKTGKTDLVGFECLFRDTANMPGGSWEGPYLSGGVMADGKMVVATWSKGQGEGFLDPWGRPYRVYTFAKGYSDTAGGILLVTAGPDGKYQTADADVFQGKPSEDDLVQLVTYNLD